LNNAKTTNSLTTGKAAIDESQLQKIYAENYYKTESFVVINSGTAEEAKDIYQEAFMVLWQKLNTGELDMNDQDRLNAFLYRVARNKWIDHLRSKEHSQKTYFNNDNTDQYDHSELQTETDQEWENKINNVLIWIKKLKPDCKRILIRFYYEKVSIRDISKQFDIDEASAKNKKYRCMEKLRKMAFDKL
jgi:RNA polymerase sigma-70 factor (ECF subfamily)